MTPCIYAIDVCISSSGQSYFPSLDRDNSVERPSFKEPFSLPKTVAPSRRYVSCKSCHLSKEIPNTRLLGGDRLLLLLAVPTYSTIGRSAGSVPIFIEGQELVKIPDLVSIATVPNSRVRRRFFLKWCFPSIPSVPCVPFLFPLFLPCDYTLCVGVPWFIRASLPRSMSP